MKNLWKKFTSALMILGLCYITTSLNPVLAQTPQALYDKAWKLIDTKFVDQTNNIQNSLGR